MEIDALYAAAIAGDADARAELEMEADNLDEEEETILHYESKSGNTDRVRFIVREFASKNLLAKVDRFKQTALHSAAQHGHTQVVEILIDAARRYLPSSWVDDPVGSFLDFVRQASELTGNSALHLAVICGKVDIVKLLVEADPSDRHVQNNQGKTPLFIAAENGNTDIVKVMCTTCEALSLEGPGGSTTAFHALIMNIPREQDDREVIMMIISAAKRWSTHASFEALFNTTDDESGKTVIELAVSENYVNAVEVILLEDPAYKRGGKKHGLMRLIYKAIDEEYSVDIVKVLSETYKDGIIPDHKGVFELILAIKSRHIELVYDLLEKAKHLTTFADDKGWTLLHYAVYLEFIPVFGLLIEAQKDIGHEFVYKEMISTPFHIGAKYGYTSTIIGLMQLWPVSLTYTAVNKDGRNMLHLAAARNNKEMIKGILKNCPNKHKDKIFKQQDVKGDTPLHILIFYGCFVPEIIKYKGLITIKNKEHWTPPDMLYASEEIIADQVEIKIALDDIMTSRSSKFWREKKKTNVLGSIVLPSRRERKNQMFKEDAASLMYRRFQRKKIDLEHHRQISKQRANSQIVVTALIITVAFTAGFTMPGGLHQSGEVDEGLVIFSRKAAFNAFVVSDALALLLSTSSLVFYFLEIINEDPYQVIKLNVASTGLSIVSLVAMLLTFIAGTYVVLSHSPALAITVCVISSLFFLLLIVLLIKIVYTHQTKKEED